MHDPIDHFLEPARQNGLLLVLPDEAWERLADSLEAIEVLSGAVLHESGVLPKHVYFPTTAVVSLLHALKDGTSAALALVGREGIVGISSFLGGGTIPCRAMVQNSGTAFRLHAGVLTTEFERAGSTMHLLLRYTQTLITQLAQTAVCNRHHSVEQQLCRWLLSSLDRLVGNELVMTQQTIAHTLGIRRGGISEVAGRLQEAGIIDYRRGRIQVLNRSGLEANVCECYGVVKLETERLLRSTPVF